MLRDVVGSSSIKSTRINGSPQSARHKGQIANQWLIAGYCRQESKYNLKLSITLYRYRFQSFFSVTLNRNVPGVQFFFGKGVDFLRLFSRQQPPFDGPYDRRFSAGDPASRVRFGKVG